MGFSDEEKDIGAAWGTGTESRNPFEKDADKRTEKSDANPFNTETRSQTDHARVNMNQGSWNDRTWQQGTQTGNSRPGGQMPGNIPGPGGLGPQPAKSTGSTAGKILLVVGMIIRGVLVIGSLLTFVAGGVYSYSFHAGSSTPDDDYYSDSSAYSFDYSELFGEDPFGEDLFGEDPFSGQGGQQESRSKDDLDDSELEDTSAPCSDDEIQEITSSAILGMNTSQSKPAAEGQWIKTRKTIDGEAYDIYFRITNIRPMDSEEIAAFNDSQNRIHLVPTSNPDFVDLMCTYEIYYPEGTPADRHQKDFYCDITSKTGTFEMKNGTVYQDTDLDDVYDVTIDPENSVTREKEIFTGQMTYAVTKDCSEYYIVCEDMDAAGMVWIHCTYEQGA